MRSVPVTTAIALHSRLAARTPAAQYFRMYLSSATIPDLERAFDQRRKLPASKTGGHTVSLAALLFLGLKGHLAEKCGDRDALALVDSVGHSKTAAIMGLMQNGRSALAGDHFKTTPFDVFNIRTRDDLKSDHWIFFCDRFRRTASRGKKSQAVLAVTGVLREMADNVVHGYADETTPCAALVGYEVTDSGLAFSVVDDGQGFLASLRRRALWQHLGSDNAALDAVVSKQATSREDQVTGGGFKQLFNGLLDLNGLVILRSGASAFLLRNEQACWKRREVESHRVPGAQITYHLTRTGVPTESAGT